MLGCQLKSSRGDVLPPNAFRRSLLWHMRRCAGSDSTTKSVFSKWGSWSVFISFKFFGGDLEERLMLPYSMCPLSINISENVTPLIDVLEDWQLLTSIIDKTAAGPSSKVKRCLNIQRVASCIIQIELSNKNKVKYRYNENINAITSGVT